MSSKNTSASNRSSSERAQSKLPKPESSGQDGDGQYYRPNPFLYFPGATFEIHSHLPPDPFGYPYPNNTRSPIPDEELESGDGPRHKLRVVIANPPAELPPHVRAKIAFTHKHQSLTVVGPVGDRAGGARLVRCYLDSDKSHHYVAKIYDAMGYPLSELDASDFWMDCMWAADMDYTREAWAYEHIPQELQGSLVPRYFGSWTMFVETGLPEPQPARRPVRLILLEFIEGDNMGAIINRAVRQAEKEKRPSHHQFLPLELDRLDHMFRIVEADMTLYWRAHIRHNDIYPRNVMITNNPARPIVIIDFNLATVYPSDSDHFKDHPLLPISPIEFFRPQLMFHEGGCFRNWSPGGWMNPNDNGETSYREASRWVFRHWAGSSRYEPLTDFFLQQMKRSSLEEWEYCVAQIKRREKERQ
ncbi:hypothetical protein B0T26DRAFT_146793 [Lasiosphaeria miniovina]|uniref:Protein kinase domain-containing protein n=1 Tax=Lasiosphaeria miniovina TaxID=1954250 RepID=A0AA40B506_9PEZI|nr:uncharacterized protein B0T26DRAFT_146793 [Lasiosphaeria miniovina]KAK0727840.1 hypothetical protein B0T26DRAFT_146793 [Lasiosphaeria miniovina]